MDVLVFRTSVSMAEHVEELSHHLTALAGEGKWSFDLEDCDRVLRVVCPSSYCDGVILLLSSHGFQCVELEDKTIA